MLVVDGIIFSLQKFGGISVYQYELLKRLVSDDLDCELLMPEKSISSITENIKALRANTRGFNNRFLERYRKASLDTKRFQNDIFHSSYYRNPSINNINKVITVHDFTYEYFSSGLKKYIHTSQKYSALQNADKIICISNNTKSDLSSFLGDDIAGRSTVIYNGVSSDYFILEHILKKPQILFVGSRAIYKGFFDAIYALAPIKDFNLVIVGGGNITPHEKNVLESVLSGRYEYIPFVNNSDLNQLYNESLCLLYPSLYEGFGIPPLEAMKAGCIPLVRNVSSLPEVVGSAGLLAKTNEREELTHLLYKLFDSEFLKERISAGLIQANKFSWDKCYLETKDIYTSF